MKYNSCLHKSEFKLTMTKSCKMLYSQQIVQLTATVMHSVMV